MAIDAETLFGIPSATNQEFHISALSGDGSTIAGTSSFFTGTPCGFSGCASSGFVYSLEQKSRLNFAGPVYHGQQTMYETMRDLSFNGQTALSVFGRFHQTTYLTPVTPANVIGNPTILQGPYSGRAMSSDGNTIIGTSNSGGFIWKPSTGVQPLPIPTSDIDWIPLNLSGDGQTIVLRAGSPTVNDSGVATTPGIYLWNESTGLRGIEPIDPLSRNHVYDLTEDGSTVVGVSSSNAFGSQTPTVWRSEIPSELPVPTEFTGGLAEAVTADGSLIVGSVFPPSELEIIYPLELLDEPSYSRSHRAVLWYDDSVVILQDWLADEWGLAAELEGWTLTSATAISADGRTIAGSGVNPDGRLVGWVVTLPVPEPASGLLLLLTACLAVLRFRLTHWQ